MVVRPSNSAWWLWLRRIAQVAATALCAMPAHSEPPGVPDQDAVLSHYSLSADSLQQWKLPKKLKEISGLAVTGDGRLLALADERAIVYEIDYTNGHLVKAFALGEPAVSDDFEAIAVAKDHVYLLTSDAVVLRASEGRDGEHVTYQRFETGLGKQCEFEGLAVDANGRNLLLACKTPRTDAGCKVYRWSLDEQRVDEAASIAIDAAAIARQIGKKKFNPSGIDVTSQGHLLLIAGPQRALAELDADGRLLAALRLPLQDRHKQPEGIVILKDGRMVIADEGGKGRGRLGIYERDR